MEERERKLQRVLIFLPILLIFYYHMFKTKQPIVYLLAAIQILTHLYLFTNNKQCTPDTDSLCNFGALMMGIIFTSIVLKNKLGVVPLLISLYMVISHLVTINLINGTFIYKDVELPIFKKQSYILIFSDLFHETKLSKFIEDNINTKKGCVIDAGAYVGDSFMILAHKHPERNFYMIEPSSENANFIDSIKSDNVKVLRNVISNQNTKYSSDNDSAPNSTYTENENGTESVRVDDIIKEPVAIMHYDVEGMELEAVLGSINLIKTFRPIVITETLGVHAEKNKKIFNIFENSTIK